LRQVLRLASPILCLSCAAITHAQQDTTGSLGGVVRDSTGAAIAAASVDVTNPTGRTQHSSSDRLGEFFFGSLPAGAYRVDVRADGFRALYIERADVALGHTLRLDALLTLAGVTQTVNATSADDLPGFDSPVNADLSPSELQALPLDGRRFQSLAQLTPLVSAEDAPPAANDTGTTAAPADSDNIRLSFRGIDPVQNRYALDGLDLTRAFDGEPRGGRVLPFTVPQEAVQEFQVRAVGAGSPLGRDAGGSVNTVTRRGESAIHGSAFFLLRNSAVSAANPFAISTRYNGGSPVTGQIKPRDQREQFGGSVGGPLLSRSKAAQPAQFYGFVGLEAQRRSFPAVSSPSDPGFYSLSAVQTALLANRGVSTTATARALMFLDSLTGSVSRHADELALLPRLDWQPTTRTTVTAEWAHVRFRSPAGQRSEPVVARGRSSLGDVSTHTDSGLLRATVALSARSLAEVRAGYSRDATFAETPAPLAAEPHTGPGGTAPQVSIAGAFTFGNAAALGARRLPDERRTEAAAQVRFSGNSHTITLGADVTGIDERIGSREATNGAYDYTSGVTNGRAGGLVDFITDYTFSATSYPNGGCPSIFAAIHLFCFRSFTQTFGSVPETRFHTAALSVFASDGWRVTPNLRIDAGVRYEYLRMPPAQHPNPVLDAAFGPFATTSTLPSDTNNLAPHLGMAYAPAKRTVVRLGYGFHFGTVPGRTLQRLLEDTARPGSQVQLRLSTRTILDPSCASAGTNFGYPATFTCSPFGPLAQAGAATVAARGFQLPAVQTGELSVTQQFAVRTTVSASYVIALSRQLPNTTDLNIAPTTATVAFRVVRNGGETGARGGEVFHVPLYTARRSAAFGPVTALLSNGSGTYHALALQVQHRTSRSLTARGSWTYSRALDNLRNSGASPDENAQFDPLEPLYDRAASNFDHTHRVVGSAVWQPRVEGTVHAIRATLNGWSVSPVIVFQSGRPYSYNITGGTSLPGGRETLNGSGGATYLPSVGRNTLRLPWSQNIDLRIARTLGQRDHLRIRLTAEAFNLLNHVNVTAVQQRAFLVGTAGADSVVPLIFQDAVTLAAEGLASRPFGTPTSSSDSPARERRLQFGLRLDW
jgi:hypothetical protein